TWQLAQGDASDPRETADRAKNHEDPRPRLIPFSWDQRHTANLTATVARPERFTLSAVLKASSGQPYTPQTSAGAFGFGLEDNSGRKPTSVIVDLRAERNLQISGVGASLFGRAFNVFDAKFNNG